MPESITLQPRYALFQTCRDDPGQGWIKILLDPFEFDGEVVTTEIRLDGIEGVDDRLQATAGKRLCFPLNPDPGCIDGSIYFHGRHHFVDVHELEFGGSGESGIPLAVRGRVTLEGHPDVAPFAIDLATFITLPLTSGQIDEVVKSAIQEVGADGPRHLGKVMAHVRPTLRYEGEAALVASAASRLLRDQLDG